MISPQTPNIEPTTELTGHHLLVRLLARRGKRYRAYWWI